MSAAPVVVVGGGIAGLSAALRLHTLGVPFRLLEASQQLGGVIRSESVDGFLLEAGADAVFAQKAEGVALAREVGLGDRLQGTLPYPTSVYVLHQRKLHALPEGMTLGIPTRIGPLITTGLFSWPAKLRMGLEPLIARKRDDEDESIASFMGRRLGLQAVERLGDPLLAGIHSGDAERLSMRATMPRMVELERVYGSLLLGLRAGRRNGAGGSPFVSLPGGLAELVDAVAARLPSASVRTGVAVSAIRPLSGGFALTTDRGEVVDASRIVMAVPPRAFAGLMEPIDSELASLLGSISSVSTAIVYLAWRRQDVAHPLQAHGFLVPRGEGLRTTACSFVSSKFAGRAPQDTVLLRAFLGGSREPGVLADSDDVLAGDVERELRPLLGLSGTPLLRRVFRWHETTPQLEVGHHLRLAAIEAAVARVPGLFFTGAGLRGTGIADMIGDGRRAADTASAF